MAAALVVLQVPSYFQPLASTSPRVAAAVTGYDATFANQSAYAVVPSAPAGAIRSFQVSFNNTGTTTWNQGTGTQVNLAVCAADGVTCNVASPNSSWNSGWLSDTAYATTTQASVMPGSFGTFSFNVALPAGTTDNLYRFFYALVLASTGEKILAEVHSEIVRVTDGTVYTVSTSADGVDPVPAGSLRAAITSANSTPGKDTIFFAIPSDGVPTINLLAPLPTIIDSVAIDGTSQTGSADRPAVELSGAGAGGSANGLTLASNSGLSVIRGLVINRFSRWGIEATAGGGSLIAGNYIGTNTLGGTALGNGTAGNSASGGIHLLTPSYRVGTGGRGDGNLVAGNYGQGIEIGSGDAPSTQVFGNIIGSGIFTRIPLPNAFNGLVVLSSRATVRFNTINGNTKMGISIGANDGLYTDNSINGNGGSGVLMSGSRNFFSRNDIRANGSSGVFMGFPGATTRDNDFSDNTVRDNTGYGYVLRGPAGDPTEITDRNRIRRGSVSGNELQGILLAFGANGGIAPPVIRRVDAGEGLSVAGTALPNAIVDIYSDPDDEGLEYHGTANADASGAWQKSGGWQAADFGALITALRAGTRVIRATQTRFVAPDQVLDTSQFSDVLRTFTLTGFATCNDDTRLPNVTVQLSQNGFVLATTTSNADGAFTFTGVGSGTFTLTFVLAESSPCTRQVTIDGGGTATFGTPRRCDPSNTWLSARRLPANGTPIYEALCDGGRRWYQIELPAGGTVVPALSRIVARLTGIEAGTLRLPGDFTLMLVRDPRLALQQVKTAADAHAQFAGDTFGGDTFGGDTFGGDTFGGDTFGGDTFGGDTFGGDTFGGDTFGGDTFGGDTFGGDTFGGDTFGGDTFGGDTFGGDTFGGDTFGGDTFGGDTFGGDTFGGDTFGGDTFGGKFTLGGGDPKAYAAAIARSVVRVAAHRGTSPEGLWQNTWASSITWYLRVSSHRGASGPFKISSQVFSGLCDGISTTPVVSSKGVPTGSYQTLILRNSAFEAGSNVIANDQAIARLKAHATVNGFVVDFANDMPAAYLQYQAKPFCPAAANLIADGIRAYIKDFRQAHPELRWILIAATDVGVPLYRVPDKAKLAPQSMLVVPLKPETVEGELRLNFFGTDDAYADLDPVVNGDHFIFQPELGVGRISEPKYLPSLVSSYIAANGLLTPQTAGVYGYNFWNDSATSIRDQLAAGGRAGQPIRVNQFTTAHPTIQSGQGLPTDPDAWNAQDLLDGVAANTDVVVLMAHGLRAATIAPANYSPVLKAEQLIQVGNTTPAIKRMKLLITGACNFALGLPVTQAIANVTPNPELSEIPQALGWTAVAWDAYAYGDDTRAAYSEELADLLVRELRYGSGPVVLGDAMARAKSAWATPGMDLTGIPEKSLMTMGIIGFPMLRVDLGTTGRLVRASDLADFASTSLDAVPAGTPGSNTELALRTKDISLDFRHAVTAHHLERTDVPLANLAAPGASYYSVVSPGDPAGQVQMTPLRPIGPRWTVPLHPSDLPSDSATFARGTVLMSASCIDEQNFVPLVSVPAYQLTPARGPFLTDRFTPNDWWKINYLDPGREFLLVRPSQFRSATSSTGAPEIFGTERTFQQMTFRTYYSSLVAQPITTADGQTMQAILAGPPEFRSHSATPNGSAIDFKVFMSGLPNLGIQNVFVTWWDTSPGAACALTSFELTRSDGTAVGQHWAGSLALSGRDPANIRYMLQAVNGSGRVRVADNFGLGFRAEPPPTLMKPLADTRLDFTTPAAAAATFSGRTMDVAARLSRVDTGELLSGKRLVFRLTGVSGYRTYAYTGADGIATAHLRVDALPGKLFAQVEFEGGDDLNGNSARSAEITVAREPASFSAMGIQPANQQVGGVVDVTARLRDGLERRLREQGVLFLITAPGCTSYVAGAAGCTVLQAQGTETDFRGDAKASFVLGVGLGSYNIHAVFASVVQLPPSITLDLQNARYVPTTANLGTLVVTNQRIVFTSTRTGNGDIYSMNVDGSDPRRLTDSAALDADPDWSPDRTKIAFTSRRTGNAEVWVMNADGSGQTQLTNNPAIDTLGSWSPDGAKLAFTSTRDGNSEIYVMNSDGSGVTRLTNNPAIDADPYWSPDGTRIAFTSTRDGNAEVYVMNSDGSNPTRLTNNPAIDTLGSWSPDGSKIVFTSSRTGSGDIYTMNSDGTGVMRLTLNSAVDGTPDWSPDGTRIVFASTRDGNSEIYVMNADGTGELRLTFNAAFDGLPSW